MLQTIIVTYKYEIFNQYGDKEKWETVTEVFDSTADLRNMLKEHRGYVVTGVWEV